MPRYTYRCNVCKGCFEAIHSISEKLTDCECGEEGSLKRVPSLPFANLSGTVNGLEHIPCLVLPEAHAQLIRCVGESQGPY